VSLRCTNVRPDVFATGGPDDEHATRKAQIRSNDILFIVKSLNIGRHANLKGCPVASGESMTLYRTSIIVASILILSACEVPSSGDEPTADHDPTVGRDPSKDLGILWVKHSAEYKAIATQVYRDATDDLPGFIEDKTWNVLTGYGDPSALPPAVILDVDETVVSNVSWIHGPPILRHCQFQVLSRL
jgi:hypothetical protein